MLPILRQLDLIILVLICERGQVAGGNCWRRRNATATHSKEQELSKKKIGSYLFSFSLKTYLCGAKRQRWQIGSFEPSDLIGIIASLRHAGDKLRGINDDEVRTARMLAARRSHPAPASRGPSGWSLPNIPVPRLEPDLRPRRQNRRAESTSRETVH